MPTVFLSHDLDWLAQRLKENLSTWEKPFFPKKWVLLSNPLGKDWLLPRLLLSSSDPVFMGISFLLLKEAIHYFLSLGEKKQQLYSYAELFFHIYSQIEANLSDLSSLKEYWESPSLSSLQRFELVEQITATFSLYGIYGKPEKNLLEDGWQDILWEKLFSSLWTAPFFAVQEAALLPEKAEVHLFHTSEIPPAYLDFFCRLGKNHSVFFYLFSPCAEFWEDQISDFELGKWIQKKRSSYVSEIKSLYADRNLFLANWGKTGKRLLKDLDRYELQMHSYYPSFEEPLYFLQMLQKDLLTLTIPSKDKKYVADPSLRIYSVGSSKLREVQILYELICQLVHEKKIAPSEVLVLAPDIQGYVPYIQTVFSSSFFDYRISQITLSSQSSLLQGFYDLLALEESKGEKQFFFRLLDNPCFIQKQGLTSSEVELWKDWIEQACIQVGMKLEDLSSPKQKENTWERGLERLLLSFVYHPETYLDSKEKEFSNAPLFEKLLLLLSSLEQEKEWLNESSHFSLAEWSLRLKTFVSTYLDPLAEENGYLCLEKVLDSLQAAKIGKPFPFSILLYYVKKQLSKEKGSFQATFYEGIHFTSLSSPDLWGGNYLFVLGMDEESFPQKEPQNSFYRLKKQIPTLGEKNRYSFLQLLFLAKKRLTFLYRDLHAEDGAEVAPCFLLEELFSYLKTHYNIEKKELLLKAPAFFSDPSQFSFKTSFPSFSFPLYEALKEPAQEKVIHFPSPHFSFSLKDRVLSLSKLVSLTKNPFRFHLQESHGVFLPPEEKTPFFLSPLDLFLFRGLLLKKNYAEIQKSWIQSGKLPSGYFQPLALHHLEKEQASFTQTLTAFSLTKEEIFSLPIGTNSSSCPYFIPCIKIPYREGEVEIVGSLPFVTLKGVICFEEESEAALWKYWPYILLLHHPSLQSIGIPPKLLFTKTKTEKKVSLSELEILWSKFLGYYAFTQKHPSLLYAPLLSAFSEKSPSLEKAVEKTLSSSWVDPYFQWFFRKKYAKVNFSTWKGYYQEIMGL